MSHSTEDAFEGIEFSNPNRKPDCQAKCDPDDKLCDLPSETHSQGNQEQVAQPKIAEVGSQAERLTISLAVRRMLVKFGVLVNSLNESVSQVIDRILTVPIKYLFAITLLNAVVGLAGGVYKGAVRINFDTKLNPEEYGSVLDLVSRAGGILANELSAKIIIGVGNFAPDKILQAGGVMLNLFTLNSFTWIEPVRNGGAWLVDMLWHNPEPYLIASLFLAGLVYFVKEICRLPINLLGIYSLAVADTLYTTGKISLLANGRKAFSQAFINYAYRHRRTTKRFNNIFRLGSNR